MVSRLYTIWGVKGVVTTPLLAKENCKIIIEKIFFNIFLILKTRLSLRGMIPLRPPV